MAEHSGEHTPSHPYERRTVYFVDHEEFRDNRRLVTHVGRVLRSPAASFPGLLAARVLIQDRTNEGARVQRISPLYPIQRLFTAEQVWDAIKADGGPLTHEDRRLPEVVVDPATNPQLTEVLAVAALLRQLEFPSSGLDTLGH